MIYDKLPVVLLSTMAAEKNSSTNHVIASYILAHRQEMADMGIQQLAEACHVGTGSVSRFVRDIGLSGFNELRSLIAQSDFSLNHAWMDEPAPIRRTKLTSYVAQSLIRMEQSVDQAQLEKLCEDIHSYQNVYVFGMLKAESAAVSLQTDLLMMSKPVLTFAAYSEQIDTIAHAGKEDLIIIFSYTGSYFSSHSFRQNEKRLMLPKIWMVCSKDHKAPWFVDEVLSFDSDGRREAHPFLLEMAASLITQQYACQFQK